ncbi:MAG TPA: trypsin-like serine protease [Vicinamibacterales bacterium]|nr:trypsin-like serine protease [Vicinamibacterales bacterium]
MMKKMERLRNPAAIVSTMACAAWLAAPPKLDAIVIRHDRDDERYRALGNQFPAVGALGRAGEGTLIADRWVLTAAHVATGFRRSTGVTFEDRRFGVSDVIAHPDWARRGPHDLALVLLADAVEGIAPIPVYRGDDESGRIVTFVGRGGTGDGRTGPVREDRIKRAATNRIEEADDRWLLFTFDEPPGGTDLEGISGPGDSGGPALIDVNGSWHVAGVSVWGRQGRAGRGTYGAQEGYTRVSRHADWIARTIAERQNAD